MRPPVVLEKATRFTDDREVASPLELVETIKTLRHIWPWLDAKTDFSKDSGRSRAPGKWALAYSAFVDSAVPDIEKWWSKHTTLELWHACGFAKKPPYQTVYQRLTELEQTEAFRGATRLVVAKGRRKNPDIGQHVHIDSTEAQTHAALVHVCPKDAPCWKRNRGQNGASQPSGDRKLPMVERPQRATDEEAREERQHLAEEAPEDKPMLGDADSFAIEHGHVIVNIGRCRYALLDETAGVRAYKRPNGTVKKFWSGFYNCKVVDHYTKAPLAIGVYSGSVQEWQFYDDVLLRTCAVLGELPRSVVADRGFSVERVFKRNSELGIASVMPWRKKHKTEERHDKVTHDRHGIPHCKHCGAECRYAGFSPFSEKGPRLYYYCDHPKTAACRKKKSISCSKDWRLLVPLWRTDPRYHELAESHSNAENVHDHFRDRYAVAEKSVKGRPKRRGLAWQQLRADAAVFIEWVRIGVREGWFDTPRRNDVQVYRNRAKSLKRYRRVMLSRARNGIGGPGGRYGRAAARQGWGEKLPPSRRDPKHRRATPLGPAPPGQPPPSDVPF